MAAPISTYAVDRVEENGRTCQSNKRGSHFCPNDEQELDRLDLQHRIFYQLFDEELALAPLDGRGLSKVLDICTGTGIWATEFAKEHPTAQVIGSDLNFISEKGIPSNCQFIVQDVCDDWHLSARYDYIHGRAALSCFIDPAAGLIPKCFSALAPGGYLELQDPLMPMSYDGPAPTESAVVRWNELTIKASETHGDGKSMTNVQKYADWMREAGFVDVEEKRFLLPTGWWKDDDPQAQRLGGWQLLNWTNAMEGFTLRQLGLLGMGPNECRDLIEEVEDELQMGKLKPWNWICVVWGRKPIS